MREGLSRWRSAECHGQDTSPFGLGEKFAERGLGHLLSPSHRPGLARRAACRLAAPVLTDMRQKIDLYGPLVRLGAGISFINPINANQRALTAARHGRPDVDRKAVDKRTQLQSAGNVLCRLSSSILHGHRRRHGSHQHGTSVRLVGFNTPEKFEPRCSRIADMSGRWWLAR